MRKILAAACCMTFIAGCTPKATAPVITQSGSVASTATSSSSASVFGSSVTYHETPVTIDPGVAAPFSIDEITNMAAIEKAYGSFTPAEKKFLADNKFVMKSVPDTSIMPANPGENGREFLSYFQTISGAGDFKNRAPQNAIFFTSDLFFHHYNLLYVELLKEMENTIFFPSMKNLSETFFKAASDKMVAASSDAEKTKWAKVRDYFAVPYAILQTTAVPPTDADASVDPDKAMAAFQTKDKTMDTAAQVSAFIKTLQLPAAEEAALLADIKHVYDADAKAVPEIFKQEYADYAAQTNIDFQVDFTQFTPRSHYTGTSLRRQYFRAMNWYIQLPFFVKSPALTEDAFAVSQLMAEHPDQLKNYSQIESAINFMVGTSDDLMPVDYLTALDQAKGQPDAAASAMDYLIKAHNPKIKSLAANYPTTGEDTQNVLNLTKGMRFFSGKFIIDSYWTGQLTQGDEAPKPGYTQKLPPMASSLEVMALLGSDYAKTKIPTLDFYKPSTSQAVDKAMTDLAAEEATLTDADWQQNLYMGWLWTIKSLFDWQKEHLAALPQFMQSPLWQVKTLQTASGFWTELRHATLLYAKQSFAELGGGPGECDTRKIPDPPKAYIEPNLQAYQRLLFLAERTKAGLTEQGFKLENMTPLDSYIEALQMTIDYTNKELANTVLIEKTKAVTNEDPIDPTKQCTHNELDGPSDWEALRTGLLAKLWASLPIPADAPVLSAKDKRMALIADVHTGGDSENPTKILYEAIGVPKVIFVAVKDANGPRLTVGFTYSHYEFTKPYGGNRLTDEDWQKNFYKEVDDYTPFEYTDESAWPAQPAWYDSIVNLK